MADKDRQDPREVLYRQFRQEALSTGIARLFYDENDLLDIYSYAQDENDDFVKVEALMLASRLYPASEAFAARKMLFYSDIAMVDEPRKMSDVISGSDVYGRLARVQLSGVAEEKELGRQLGEILASAESLDEDDIILMSEIAMDHGMTSWLLDNRKEIVAKAEYAPTFFYELALYSFEDGEFGRAMEMAEELVDAEPMNGDFWELYSDIALSASDFEKGLSAAEFALAINPDSWKAMSLKGQALFHLDRDIDEATRLLEKVLHSGGEVTYHVPLVLALIYQHDPERATACLCYYIDNIQLSREVLVTLSMVCEERARGYLEQFENKMLSLGETYFTEWALELVRQGSIRFAATVLTVYDSLTSEETKSGRFYNTMYELLYRSGLFKQIVDMMNDEENVFFAPVAEMAKLMSYVRIGENGRALEEARMNLKALEAFDTDTLPVPSLEFKMQRDYVVDMLRRFVAALSKSELPPEREFNPFV